MPPRKIKIVKPTTHSVVRASYVQDVSFTLPSGVKLLSHEEKEPDVPFSWWIRWNTLHWLDKDLVEHEVDGVLEDACYKTVEEDLIQMDEEDDE